MQLLSGLIGGLIGGVIGAAAWAGISYATGYEIGWIAWGVGGLVGFGVVMGWKGGGVAAGALAVAISIIAILAGKYAAMHFLIQQEFSSKAVDEVVHDPEFLISEIADDIAAQREAAGETLNWPIFNEAADDFASGYPPDVWSEASVQWRNMSQPEQDQFREQTRQTLTSEWATLYETLGTEMTKQGFLASFAAIDLLFFGLAVVTAYRLAASGKREEVEI